MRSFRESIGSKRVGIVGGGISGVSASLLLKKLGTNVFLTERKRLNYERRELLLLNGVKFEEGGHTSRILGMEMIIVSPGVPPDSPIMKTIEESEITYMDELELGWRFLNGKVIAVTGTNGKSTVVSWIAHTLGELSVEAGNIGNPVTSIKRNAPFYVLEVSSFQLERTLDFRPDVAVILNIDTDHMDWHPTLEHYVNAKKKIFRNQRENDLLILNWDDKRTRKLSEETPSKTYYYSLFEKVKGAYLENGKLIIEVDKRVDLLDEKEINLKGQFNLSNALSVALALYLVGIDVDRIRSGLKSFRGLPHRLEFVGEKDGVKFINDSKSTNPHSLKAAIEAIDQGIILIAGGQNKGLSFESLKENVREKVKFLILLGESKEEFKKTFGKITKIIEASTMDEAVIIAFDVAEEGDIVLLSPGCASFDMFKNYRERGEAFKNAVKKRILQMG